MQTLQRFYSNCGNQPSSTQANIFSHRQLNSFNGLKESLDGNLQNTSARRKQDNEFLKINN